MRYSQVLFYLLFLSFQATFSSFSSSTTQVCSYEQSVALIQFKTLFSITKNVSYNHCDHRSYPKTNSWKEGIDCCLWDGVECDNTTGQVISLDLSCSWLSGTLPSNSSLFLLSHLQRLDLSFNDFKKSNISSHFGRFASLKHLDLAGSWFAGQVPHEISYLSKLVFLDLSSYSEYDLLQIQAPEPILKIEKSILNGIVWNLTEVREIKLNGIDMSHVEPNSFSNLSYSLTSLSLFGCDLCGNFPENVFKLPNVKSLNVVNNLRLTGQLPKSNWSSPLEYLDVSITSFLGELPESVGNLRSLVDLALVGCNFSGMIPSSLGLLSQVRSLFLPYNKFFGKIPSTFTSLSKLTHLVLNDNQLEGYIPNQPNAFQNLRYLHLSDNLLSGKLPSWLFNHPTLRFLDLANNQFVGHINEFQHSFLDYVNFKNNSFQGRIPTSISKLVNITFLDLSSNILTDTLSWDIFSKLQRLTWLDLSANALSLVSSNSSFNFVLPNLEYVNLTLCNISEFPHFLQGSKVLTWLDLSNSRIQGKIARFPWKTIEFLDLHSNFLQGILAILPQNIRFFSVSNNNFTGEISTVCNMKSIEILDLSQNNFNGTIPPCVGSFSKSLSLLNLKMNKFHGIIPPSFFKGCGLKNLNLNGNLLEGPFTGSISNCKDLEVIDIGNNMINDEFPHWIELLPELQVLILRSNMFRGSISASKNPQSLSKIRIIDLSYNNFFGPLPINYVRNFEGMKKLDEGKAVHYMEERNYSYDYSVSLVVKGLEIELVKILTIFTSIDLSSNNFVGEIPGILGGLSSLRGLNLSHNSLFGHIPPSLGNLTNLEWLDLSSNKLDGQIPRELMDLTFLSSFKVSNNQLVGAIPQGNQFNTFDNDSYKGNEGLCGYPLSRGCSNNQPPPPSTKMHQNDGPKIEFGWEVVLIGYGLGFIFGVVIDYLRLRLRKVK